jgi:hypothetical protein
VEDVVGMGAGHRLANRLVHGQQPAPVGRGVVAPPEKPFEGAPLDEFHHQERPTVGQPARLVDRRDAGVLELPGDPGLGEEALGGRRVGRVVAGQELDGHVPAEGGVAGAVDDAHAAAADLLKQFVPRRIRRGGVAGGSVVLGRGVSRLIVAHGHSLRTTGRDRGRARPRDCG